MEDAQLQSFGFGGMGIGMFQFIPTIITIVFIVVIGIIVFRAIQGVMQWKANNESPILNVPARICAKRASTHTSHHAGGTDGMHAHHTTSTNYYATFEFENGDRKEFRIKSREYGLLVEGDSGMLTFQGTRYLGFERHR